MSQAEAFVQFRTDLDEHNDRRERIIKVSVSLQFSCRQLNWIKASRDITSLSKKIIFLLHRTVTENAHEPDHILSLRAASRGRDKLCEVQILFAALKHEFAGDRFWRYQRNVSPGLQEYIEALSFTHYLEQGTLVSFDEVQLTLSDNEGQHVRYVHSCR
jgi:predicted translin family RNA/ssDNA-binding protein